MARLRNQLGRFSARTQAVLIVVAGTGKSHKRNQFAPAARLAYRGRLMSDLFPRVYDELRRLAARQLADEAPGQTLDATALVHEAYLRLVRAGSVRDGSPSRGPNIKADLAVRGPQIIPKRASVCRTDSAFSKRRPY
jgi:hypothetical protein